MSNSAVSIATVLGDAGDIPIADAGGYFTADNVEDALQQLAGGVGPTTIYVATTGDDVTGDGSSGDPYETLDRALEDIPRILNSEVVIDVANGTYAEPIEITGFYCTANGLIKITGDTSTPANVKFTGSVSIVEAVFANTVTCVAAISGRVFVELEGITLEPASSRDRALNVQSNAYVYFDRCNISKSSGTLNYGIQLVDKAHLELQGSVTIADWSVYGLRVTRGASASWSAAGTLTITGPGTTGIGVNVGYHSRFVISSTETGRNITITGVQFGFQLGLSGLFQHLGGSSTITIDNASTPSSSCGVQTTDLSSWSTTQAVVIDNFSFAFQANSISYIEAAGSRTITNVGDTDDASQNSVIYLP